MSTTPILPHLIFRCRIVAGVSTGFFRTPPPEGGAGGVSDAPGVDTYRRLSGDTDSVSRVIRLKVSDRNSFDCHRLANL